MASRCADLADTRFWIGSKKNSRYIIGYLRYVDCTGILEGFTVIECRFYWTHAMRFHHTRGFFQTKKNTEPEALPYKLLLHFGCSAAVVSVDKIQFTVVLLHFYCSLTINICSVRGEPPFAQTMSSHYHNLDRFYMIPWMHYMLCIKLHNK